MPFCRNCGQAYTNQDAQFCPNCGKPIQTSVASTYPPTAPQVTQVKYCQKCGTPNDSLAVACKNCGNRTFDAIPSIKVSRPTGVTIIVALQILGGLVILATGLASIFLAAFLVPVGALTLLIALALFSGREWARILMLILAVLECLTIVGLIFGLPVLWYLRKPDVVAYFKQPK